MRLLRNLASLLRLAALPADQRHITFYSEGENYWPYLEALVLELLETTELTINYISSSTNDPGVSYQHDRLNTFVTDEGHLRNYLFENLATDVMVMTMPDLGSFQIKRSRNSVHYVYVQHSLVSLHMAYREGAFDEFDTLFCAGPHHVAECTEIRRSRNLPPIAMIEHGYPRLDSILKEVAQQKNVNKHKHTTGQHILFAPTWGPNCAIESGAADKIVADLLASGNRVTLRPHPQTNKLSPGKVSAIVERHQDNKDFAFEANVAGQKSLHDSDVLISDWSGAALDYAFGLGKPIVFLDVPKKINNPNYHLIKRLPFEESIRDVVGNVVPVDDVQIPQQRKNYNTSDYVFNPGAAASVGATYLSSLVEGLAKDTSKDCSEESAT